MYTVLLLCICGMLCIRHIGDLSYGLSLLSFPSVAFFGLILQQQYAGNYYSRGSAFSAISLYLAMVVLVIIICQRGYGGFIWKIINGIVLVCSWLIILQSVVHLFGIRLTELGLFSELFFNGWESTIATRLCGPFSEASHFAQHAMLSLVYFVFIRPSWGKAAVVVIAMLLSTSSLALVGIGLLFVALILNLKPLFGLSGKYSYLAFLLCLVVGAGVVLLLAYFDAYILTRTLQSSSLSVRFLRSLDLFGLLSWPERLFGVGLQNQALYLNWYRIILAHDTYETTIGANREFAGLIGYLLCTSGVFGVGAFLLPLIRLLFQGKLATRIIVVTFLYICLFCCIFSSFVLILYFIALYATFDMERHGLTLAQPAREEACES